MNCFRSISALLWVLLLCNGNLKNDCATEPAWQADVEEQLKSKNEKPFVLVLGIAQDAGYPQAGCRKKCCQRVWKDSSLRRYATSIAIVDPETNERFLVDCTPDVREQIQMLDEAHPVEAEPGIDGILLTHAHIGHYAGLIHFGREAMGTKGVPVFAMPRMKAFLNQNGPWSQLVKLNNIKLKGLENSKTIQLNKRISITPITVPHRDEFSETVAYVVKGPSKSLLFLPDIDKWSRWELDIEHVVGKVDVALLDGSFYANGEIPGRDMSLIPHPFIEESIKRFGDWDAGQRNKIQFIHLNHTNPALINDGEAKKAIERAGMHVANQGAKINL